MVRMLMQEYFLVASKKFKSRQFTYFLSTAAVIVFLDQVTKIFIEKTNPSWWWGPVGIVFHQNTGAAFSLFQGQIKILGLISLLVATVLLLAYPYLVEDTWTLLLWAGFFAGTVGNMIDRLFRDYVIDFLASTFWATFNVADAALTLSVIGLIIYFSKKEATTSQKKS